MRSPQPPGAAGARVAGVVAVLVIAASASAACTSSGSGDDTTATTTSRPPATTGSAADAGRIEWDECGSAECGTLVVPRDYAEPDGPTIEVALIRFPARDEEARIGPLLMNPGGPGAAGVPFVREFYSSLPAEIRDRFDVIGFDPRGTGGTLPVDCTDDLSGVFALDTSPDDADDRAELEAGVEELVRECERTAADVLPHVGSRATVQDMDAIREALGDEQLSYVGYSYGTYLGTLYAHDFPERVRTMVLDGAVDPLLSAGEIALQQAKGFETSLDAFFEWCASSRSCPFGEGEPAAAYDELFAAIDAEPVEAFDDRVLHQGEADLGVAQALYFGEEGWPILAEALADAADGDGTFLLQLSDEYTGRLDDGTYDDQQEAFWAISCLDGPPYAGEEELDQIAARARVEAPRVGPAVVYASFACAFWPVPAAPAIESVTTDTAVPLLVIGTTGDPATPLVWAEGLADALGDAVLLVAEGEQHTSFVSAGNDCVDDTVVAYLVDEDVPADGTVCR